MNLNSLPKWAREIVRFHAVKPQFALSGNVRDVHPAELGGATTALRLRDFLRHLLKACGYGVVLHYEPLVGFHLLEGEPDLARRVAGVALEPGKPLAASLPKAAELLERLAQTADAATAVLLDFASRFPEVAEQDVREFHYRLFRLAHAATARLPPGAESPMHHLVFWLLEKENDLPPWYTLDNARVRTITIPKPDGEERRALAAALVRNLPGHAGADERRRAEALSLLVDGTAGLFASEIVAIVTLARREKIALPEIGEAIRMYKLGVTENPWSKLDPVKVAATEAALEARVKGQPRALRKAAEIVKRAVFNLSGSQYSRFSQRPKGVLFFAGPTGVGKTELAKAITEHLFGSETNYIRFDMSEFAHEHADQRLVGAPPGYVGYEVGGELTNAVKGRPFSVILFDEIEKAHPKILDIFLQILDDGRLTSGRGETVWFSESLVVFTSNLGVYETLPTGEKVRRVSPDMPYDEVRARILEAVGDHFKFRIGRPEILNRIGENIVVFDFIRPETARRILERMVGNVRAVIADAHGIAVDVSPAALETMAEAACADLTMGGRGVGNVLEAVFVNPLSRALFDGGFRSGDAATVTGVSFDGVSWTVELLRK